MCPSWWVASVFISETYGPGSSMLAVKPGGYDVVWQDNPRGRRKAFQAHWSTPMYVDGYLYGCSGRNSPDAQLRCIEWNTGRVAWSVADAVHSSLLYVDGHFVCLDEYGRLRLIKANPAQCEVVSQLNLGQRHPRSTPERTHARRLLRFPCWAAPILAHGLLYVRGKDRLLCLELIPGSRN